MRGSSDRSRGGAHSDLAPAYGGAARAKRVPEALPEQESLLGECERARQPDGYVQEELAECLLALGRKKEAAAHFGRAYELLSRDASFPSDEVARLQRMKDLRDLP